MTKRVATFLLLVFALVSVGLTTGAANPASVPYCVSSPLYEQPNCYGTAAEAALDPGDLNAP